MRSLTVAPGGETSWTGRAPRCCTVRVRHPSPSMFRGLARSSPWRWRALSFELTRRPLHGPEHLVLGRLERGVGLDVRRPVAVQQSARRASYAWRGATGSGTSELPFAWELPVEVDADGFVVRRPPEQVSDDPMWQDYQFVAMLDPVELADGWPRDPDPGWTPDAAPPPALDVARVDSTVRRGRETWWAEVAPLDQYEPRCSCCPLLFGRVSEGLLAAGAGPAPVDVRPHGFAHTTAYLVALDVQTGVCVHVEHLDGSFVGRGFSLDVVGVD